MVHFRTGTGNIEDDPEAFIVFQSLSRVRFFATPWTAVYQTSLSFIISQFAQTHVHWVGDAIQPPHPLSPPSPPALNLSQHQGLVQWVRFLLHVAKVLELQLQHQSFQYSGLISFRIDWFDLLAVEGTFESLLQHHSSKSSILWCSVFFMIQLSYPYMTTGKTITLTRQTFVGKVMSLLFNILSGLIIAFLARSKRLLISYRSHHLQWFWSPRK